MNSGVLSRPQQIIYLAADLVLSRKFIYIFQQHEILAEVIALTLKQALAIAMENLSARSNW